MELYIDFRETKSGLVSEFAKRDIAVTVRYLKTGDIKIRNQVVIERKTFDDLVLSVIDGRIFRQCSKLANSPMCSMIIVEGETTQFEFRREAILGLLLNIMIFWQIPILFTVNIAETVQAVITLMKQLEKQNLTIYQRKGYRPKRIKTKQLRMIQGLPGIGAKRSLQLLERFGSVRKVLLAGEDDLCSVEGIGKQTAKDIQKLLDHDFVQ